MFFLGSLDDYGLVEIWYRWKDLVESFPTSIFLSFFELRLFFYEFSKFSGKSMISYFFGQRPMAVSAGSSSSRQLLTWPVSGC